jgi:hypothetical protein
MAGFTVFAFPTSLGRRGVQGWKGRRLADWLRWVGHLPRLNVSVATFQLL